MIVTIVLLDVQRVYDNTKLNTQFSRGRETESVAVRIAEGRVFARS